MKIAEYRSQVTEIEATARECVGNEDWQGFDFSVASLQGVARVIRGAIWQPPYRDEATEVAGEADTALDRLADVERTARYGRVD